MPTYDYVCDGCGHCFELFQSIMAEAEKKCPQCGKIKLRRLIGPGAAVIFKGSGFYQTDYRSESYTKAAQAEKKSTSEASSASDSKDGKKKQSAKKKSPASSSS